MIVAKAVDPILFCHFGLSNTRFLLTQIIIAQVGRYVRLIVPAKSGPSRRHVYPFGKTMPPPEIVFRDGMVLGKIKGNHFHWTMYLSALATKTYFSFASKDSVRSNLSCATCSETNPTMKTTTDMVINMADVGP